MYFVISPPIQYKYVQKQENNQVPKSTSSSSSNESAAGAFSNSINLRKQFDSRLLNKANRKEICSTINDEHDFDQDQDEDRNYEQYTLNDDSSMTTVTTQDHRAGNSYLKYINSNPVLKQKIERRKLASKQQQICEDYDDADELDIDHRIGNRNHRIKKEKSNDSLKIKMKRSESWDAKTKTYSK